jgi:hypothetical protein
VNTVAASDRVGIAAPHSGQNLDRSPTLARQDGQITAGFYQPAAV